MSEVRHVLASATTWGLPDVATRPPPRPLDGPRWSAVLGLAVHERVVGPLAWAIDDGWWPATDAQAAAAADAHRAAMATCLHLERHLVVLGADLDRAGARWCVLKGPAIAHLDERDPALRSFGDLDLLVAAEDLARVYAHLIQQGGRRRHTGPAPAFDRRFGKGAAHRLPDGTEIDVHRTLALGPYGLTIEPDDVLDHVTAIELGGRSVPVPDRGSRFLHACVHAALGQRTPRLSALRDVVLTAPRDGDEARAVHRAACRWQIEAVVAAALVDASRVLRWSDRSPLLAWATALRPSRRDRRWLRAYRGPTATSTRRTLLAVEAVPGASARLAYAAGVATSGLTERRTDRPGGADR